MKLLKSIVALVVIFNYCLITFAENQFYIVSIRRNKNDKNFDDESQKVQEAIVDLANERMNDIYDMIIENKETYVDEDGKLDENLKELENNLKKRKEHKKFRFINKNRRKSYKRNLDSNEEIIDSNIVKYLCPITNFYTILVYLSDSIVEDVKKLPNVIYMEKNYQLESNAEYFDSNIIAYETHWNDLWIQNNASMHLSILSQSKYVESLTGEYDNNYYIPSKMGHGIDIYIIDDGLWTDHIDFNTYEGQVIERTITCDGIFIEDTYTEPSSSKKCSINSEYPYHGTAMASLAAGTIYGASKQSNIHMLATKSTIGSIYHALNYISQNVNPRKSVISISMSKLGEYSYNVEKYLRDLANKGYIIFVSGGNQSENACIPNSDGNYYMFSFYDGVITIGATNKYKFSDYSNYGSCIDFFSHGGVTFAYSEINNTDYRSSEGTSGATAIAAGLAAVIMSEYPNIQFNYERMRNALINLSLKDIISDLPSGTPNRFLNNGKKTVFSPINVYNGCGYSSGSKVCPSGQCCSKYSYCGKSNEYCDVGCQSEFGVCNSTKTTSTKKTTTTTTTKKTTTTTKKTTTTTKKTTTTTKKTTTTTKKTTTTTKKTTTTTVNNKCGPGYGKCSGNNCCSKYGYCGTTVGYCSSGCQSLYGICK